MIEALTWALELDPATLKWPAAVLVALCFALVLFGLVQYQAFNRLWGIQLVLGLAGGAVVVGLGAATHWLLGVVYGVGYLLMWLVWVLTRRWRWWRRALARGLAAGLTLGPWLWLGATEKAMLESVLQRGGASRMAEWLLAPTGLIWFWMTLGALWLLVLVGGWGCWRWPLVRPQRRRWLVVTWAVLGVLGLNWYAAGRVDLLNACKKGHSWRLGYVLVSRPGCQWYCNEDGGTLLHYAAASGQARVIRVLLAAGAEANAQIGEGEYAGWTPLHLAAERGKAEAIRALLRGRADIEAMTKAPRNGDTPLHRAVKRGRFEVIRLLLDAGADPNAKAEGEPTPLHLAAAGDDAEAIRLLLAAGADVNAPAFAGSTPLSWAAQGGHAEAIRLLLAAGATPNAKQGDGRTPLCEAATNAEATRLLLAAGAKVNIKDKDGVTPLHRAAMRSNAEALSLLLSAGATVNERNNEGKTALDLSDEAWARYRPASTEECGQLLRQAGGKTTEELDHWTPLHKALWEGNAEEIRVLLAAGADPNARADDGRTPLHLARGNAAAIQLLLAAGADVHAKAKNGWTPLHLAAENGDAGAIRLLLAAGAGVNAKDNDGWTPLHRAAANVNADAIRLLLAAAARVNERANDGNTALDCALGDACRQLLRQAGGKTGKELDGEKAQPAPEPAPPEPGR